MSKPRANARTLPPSRRDRACAAAAGITTITTTTGITRKVRPVVFV